MRRGFAGNNRGLLGELFGRIAKILGFLLELGVLLGIIIVLLATTGALDKWGYGGLGRSISAGFSKIPIIGAMPAYAKETYENLLTPAEFDKETAQAGQSTETRAGSGVVVVEDQKVRTGIFSQSPSSGHKYILEVGIKNPTIDFIAESSKLAISNDGNVTNKTGLTFEPFKWDTGNTVETIAPQSYRYATAKSTTPALVVKTPEEAGSTYVDLEVDYSYDFKAKENLGMTGLAGGELIMYQVIFAVCPRKFVSEKDKEKMKDKYKAIDSAAGGPVTVTRTVTEPCIQPGDNLKLSFEIKNADANSGVFEAIDFKGGPTTDRIWLIVPNILTADSEFLDCTPVAGKDYQRCKIKNLLESNLATMQEKACYLDGCLFHNYDPAQGFGPSSSILTDEPNERISINAYFKANANIEDTTYAIQMMFLDGAYTYHAAMKKTPFGVIR